MLRDSLIPNNHRARFIAHTTAEIMSTVDVVEQELQHVVRLFLVPAHNTLGIGGVDKECLLFGDRVDDYDWVDGSSNWSTEDGIGAVVANLAHDRVRGCVNCLETLETLAERG